MTIWLTIIAVVLSDQATKWAVIAALHPHASRMIVARLLYFTYVPNTHGAFGLFGNAYGLLVLGTLAALAIVFSAARRSIARDRAAQIGFGAVAGGALSNIADRLVHGYVVDFIDVRVWPVFNLADSCVTVGLGLLLLAGRKRSAA